MSIFDPEAFMNTTFTEAFDTKFQPVPEGEYPAVIEKVEINEWRSKSTGASGLRLDVTWRVDDPSVSEATGLSNPTVRQGIMLDLTENGGLAAGPGKNINLGRLREAVGQNVPGKPWSPSMLIGQAACIRVGHRIYEGEIYAEVRGVTKL